MILDDLKDLKENKEPLSLVDLPEPEPEDDEILIKVSVCGVCHTELDEIEGRTAPPSFPIVLGHQVVGTVIKTPGAKQFKIGDRVGSGWIYSACGECDYCLSGNENLCEKFKATGRDVNGGYAEYFKVPEKFAYKIPDIFSDAEAAPLLCAGAIGYRSLKLSGIKDGASLGLTGFGASAHLVLKLVKFSMPNTKLFIFARSQNEREFAMELGADWAGDTNDSPPEQPDSIIDTTPVWSPIVAALKILKPGGRLVINAIRKENIDKDVLLNIDFHEHLWMEKEIKSVANVASSDIRDFLHIAAKIPLKPEYQEYKLEDANTAIIELKERKIRGAKVLVI